MSRKRSNSVLTDLDYDLDTFTSKRFCVDMLSDEVLGDFSNEIFEMNNNTMYDTPVIKSLQDIITMTELNNYYNNINNIKLYAIIPGVKRLIAMSGIENIKNEILGIIIYYLCGYGYHDNDYLHTMITGGPGTGKTTLAEIIGEIYSHLSILSTGVFIKAKRSDLIGKFCGYTTVMVNEIVQSAKGGTLLIDETYNLGGTPDHADSFSIECVNALNQNLSEYKKDFICIIAGYADALENSFFSLNKGLQRRFAWHFDMSENVNLCDIMKSQAKECGWEMSIDAIDEIFFIKNKKFFINGGGSTELLLAKCKITHAIRLFGKIQNSIITRSDVETGFSRYKANINQSVNKSPPHGMYQ